MKCQRRFQSISKFLMLNMMTYRWPGDGATETAALKTAGAGAGRNFTGPSTCDCSGTADTDTDDGRNNRLAEALRNFDLASSVSSGCLTLVKLFGLSARKTAKSANAFT